VRWRGKLGAWWAAYRERARREKKLRSMDELTRLRHEAVEMSRKHPPPPSITQPLSEIPLEERRRRRLPLD
jgi:hypothetical protein